LGKKTPGGGEWTDGGARSIKTSVNRFGQKSLRTALGAAKERKKTTHQRTTTTKNAIHAAPNAEEECG